MPVVPADLGYESLGPGTILLGFNTGALEVLGISVDGIRVSEQQFDKAILTDLGGPDTPVDFQDMGSMHIIRARFSCLSQTTLDKMKRRRIGQADGANPGDALRRGAPMAATGRTFRMVLSSPARPRRYHHVITRGPIDWNHGTEHGIYSFEWLAFSPQIVTSGSITLAPLYDSVEA